VEIVEDAEQCAQEGLGLGAGHALAGVDAGLQRGALDVVLDDDEGGVLAELGDVGGRDGAGAVGGEELVAAGDAGVAQGGEDLGLALEQFHDLPVAHAGDGQLLEDDGLAGVVAGEEGDAEAAFAELADEGVGGAGARDALVGGELGHGGRW
jgi:hypothetical protein